MLRAACLRLLLRHGRDTRAAAVRRRRSARPGRRSRTAPGDRPGGAPASTGTRPARSSGTPSERASGEAGTPAAQITVPASSRSSPIDDAVARRWRSRACRSSTSTPQPLERAARGLPQIFGERREDASARPRSARRASRRRIDRAEFVGQRVARDLRDGAGHLDAGRPAADRRRTSASRRRRSRSSSRSAIS